MGVEEDWGVDCVRTEREIGREQEADEKDEYEIAEAKKAKAEAREVAVKTLSGGARAKGAVVTEDQDPEMGSVAGSLMSSDAGSTGEQERAAKAQKGERGGDEEDEGDEGGDEDGDVDGLDLDPFAVAQGRAVMVQRIQGAQRTFLQALLVLLQSKVHVKHPLASADSSAPNVDTGSAAGALSRTLSAPSPSHALCYALSHPLSHASPGCSAILLMPASGVALHLEAVA
jgi:hypothetical protein